MKTDGQHVICDLWLVESVSQKEVLRVLTSAISKGGLNVVGEAYKDFGGDAFTVAFILSESHFSAHYFPERNYIAIDCFTCGDEGNPISAVAYVVKELNAQETSIKVIKRGMK
jgi:S-adenosylmethionine decarboxylase